MVFDEWYGELSYAQRAAYRKFHVSPSDHDELVERYGQSNHKVITDAVKEFSSNGMFSSYLLWNS